MGVNEEVFVEKNLGYEIIVPSQYFVVIHFTPHTYPRVEFDEVFYDIDSSRTFEKSVSRIAKILGKPWTLFSVVHLNSRQLS